MGVPMVIPGSSDEPRPQGERGHADYVARRAWIEEYFDRTASAAWARLTSDAPVSRIRATVRAGRDRMRTTLASWLPFDLADARVLDAGCGPGQLAIELARRGADVLAVDLSPTLVGIAKERMPADLAGTIDWRAGDMLDDAFGRFAHVVAMDSVIHYRPDDAVRALGRLAARTDRSILFTFAPRTPLLAVMHAAGKLFPRRDRAPQIEPVTEDGLRRRIAAEPTLAGWRVGRTQRVASGFYTSQAMELVRG